MHGHISLKPEDRERSASVRTHLVDFVVVESAVTSLVRLANKRRTLERAVLFTVPVSLKLFANHQLAVAANNGLDEFVPESFPVSVFRKMERCIIRGLIPHKEREPYFVICLDMR